MRGTRTGVPGGPVRAAGVVPALLACMLAAVAAGLAAPAPAAVAGPPASAPGGAVGGPATPLLSARRVPSWVERTVAAQREATTLSGALTPAALGPATPTTCMLVEQAGRVIAATAPDRPMVPASNVKVLTATAALDVLGAGHRYTTSVAASAAPQGGKLGGDLYLVGGGDPVLRTPQYTATIPDAAGPTTSLPQLAAQVRAAGITEITGTVVGDESRYDTVRTIAGWDAGYTAEGDAGPLSALEVDDGFHATLGPAAGPGPFAADADPAQAAAQTFAGLLLADGVRIDAPPMPPPALPAPRPGTPAPTPAAQAATAAALAAAAEAATAHAGVAPAGAVPVTSIQSPPLGQLLEAVLAPSDDTAAELVTKELGRARAGQGSTAAGTAAIRDDLTADGLPTAGLVLGDGSGLDRADRATCGLVAAALDRAGTASPLAGELAVAGRTGTLARRLGGPLTAGRVVAKTGTLDDVSALSGFVLPRAAPPPPPALRSPLTFSLIVDGLPAGAGMAIGDAVATALAGYPSAPDPAALGPRR